MSSPESDRGPDAIEPSVEALREALRVTREENAVLRERLADLTSDRAGDRAARRAALNLLEDAVRSREAEQRENEERRRVERALRDADRRKDEFLATLAHELRNPLAPLRNSLMVLRLSPSGAAPAHVYDMMARNLEHLARLVEDLMEVSRITRGVIELRKQRIELGALVADAVESSQPVWLAAGHEMVVRPPNTPLWIEADPVRLSQVVTNLLSNAVKYTGPGGRIEVDVGRDGPHAVIRVRDTGIGIEPEMLEKVFDLFTQVHRGRGSRHDGLGIGLTLVRSLVRLHGGEVFAHSAGLGEGAEVTVRLPLEVVPVEAPVVRSPKPARHRGRVLVVDDNQDSCHSLALMLDLLGNDVQVANDGPSALEKIRSGWPTAVLLDIGMPGMSGYEVAEKARQMPEGRGLLIIALTGWGQADDRRRSLEAGIDHHLVKPVDVAALVGLLAPQSRRAG